jgi:hypothetical protein
VVYRFLFWVTAPPCPGRQYKKEVPRTSHLLGFSHSSPSIKSQYPKSTYQSNYSIPRSVSFLGTFLCWYSLTAGRCFCINYRSRAHPQSLLQASHYQNNIISGGRHTSDPHKKKREKKLTKNSKKKKRNTPLIATPPDIHV